MAIRSIFLSCGPNRRNFAHDLVTALYFEEIEVWNGLNIDLEKRKEFDVLVKFLLERSRPILAVVASKDNRHVIDECETARRDAKFFVVLTSDLVSSDLFQGTRLEKAPKFDLTRWKIGEESDDFNKLVIALRECLENLWQEENPGISNPAKNPEFFELLRDLNETFSLLKDEIRAINDPDRRTADINAVSAYIEAFSVFLNNANGAAPEKIPVGIIAGLLRYLRSIKWFEFSKHAQKWADTCIKILERFLN